MEEMGLIVDRSSFWADWTCFLAVFDWLGLFLRGVGSEVPYFHWVDLECALLSPSWPPLSLVVIEFWWGSLWSVGPGFGSNSIPKVASSASDCEVEDDVVRFIEWCIFVCWVLPGIAPVWNAWTLPIALGGVVDLQYPVRIAVQISVNGLIIPIHSIGMEIISKGAGWCRFLRMGFGVLIGEEIGSPMHSRAESLGSSSEFSGIVEVASALHDIDFSAGWPFAVLVVTREHPDCGPEPIAFWQFGLNLNSSVLDFERVNSGQFSAHHRIDVVVAIASSAASVEEISSALVSRWATPQIISIAGSHILHSDFVFSQHWFDVQHSVFDESGAPVVVVDLEFPVASTG